MAKKILILAAVCAFCAGAAQAKVVLPDIMSDNMVLQHSTNVNLWGKAAPNDIVKVKLSWCDTTFVFETDANGNWIANVPTREPSYEPEQITISDKDGEVSLENILIGEVWFCSGQSNMEMPLRGLTDAPIENSAELIATSGKWKGIRVATVPKTPAMEPAEETPGKWKVSNPDNAPDFTAIGYAFAMLLNTALDVPVGILHCSWGGTRVEGWSSRETLAAYPDEDVDETFKNYVIPPDGGEWYSRLPMVMFNGMLYPLRHYTIKGFLWYQGCSNVGHADTYAERLYNMVEEWRGLWKQGDLPFYMVEIAPYEYGGDDTAAARLRESQFKASRMISNSGIICTNDLVKPSEFNQIHPSIKQEIGNRLAYMVLNKVYGYERIVCEGPIYKEMKVVDGNVEVYFYNDQMGLNDWNEIVGFELAGEDQVFHPAKAYVAQFQNKVVVHSDSVPEPVAVRYCFKNFSLGNLKGDQSMPAFPFRSDEW